MEIAPNAAVVATTKTSISTSNGLLASQVLALGRSQDGVYIPGGLKVEHAALTLKGSLEDKGYQQQQQGSNLPAANSAAPKTPSQCNIFTFTSAVSAVAAGTNNMKTPKAIIDSAIITSSSNSVSSATTTQSNSKKSTNSTTKSSATTSSASTKSSSTKSSSTKSSTTNSSSTNSSNSVTIGAKNYFRIPSDILDDLASRFIINMPDLELSNLIRICFQIELAHWFYLDFFCSIEEKKLQPCGIKPFAMQIFQHIPFLREHLSSIDKILEDWKNYKLAVPTYGAILISEDLNFCLLVQSYFAKSSWGFPKGKVNENEDPVHCAAREVFEETGYDITGLIVPNDFIEAVINYQYTRLYIVRDVSLKTQFSPRTRNEIKCCDWFPIDSLPISKSDAISKAKLGLNANSFFMIMPFVKRLKKWVNDKRSGIDTRHEFPGGGLQAIIRDAPSSTQSATATNTGGSIQKNSNSSKKNNRQQQQCNDDNNALNNVGVGGGGAGRSKRQRHKSMGDLDGVRLSLNNNSGSNNCKSTKNNNCGGANGNANHSSTNGCTALGGVGGSSKRNSAKNSAAIGGSATGNATGPPRRQLFHSQSQNGEKNVASSDSIRKEKQQQQSKAEKSKAQKQQQQQQQQQQTQGNTRVRAKSQSDKISTQQQQQNVNKNNNNNAINNSSSKQRLQKQQSVIINNSSNMNNVNNKIAGRFTPSPISGAGLVAVATVAAAAQTSNLTNNMYVDNKTIIKTSAGAAEATTTRSKPSPVSTQDTVTSASLPSSSPPRQQLLLQRMASGTNLRILKRANLQQQAQQIEQNAVLQPLKFTPSFDSWTNFSFTKNFIANVFC